MLHPFIATALTEVNRQFFRTESSDTVLCDEGAGKKSGRLIDEHTTCVCTCFNISSGAYYLTFLVYSYAAAVLNPPSKPG